MQQQLQMLEHQVKNYLSKEALSRFGNLKTAHQDIAFKAVLVLARAIESGQLKHELSDEEFKSLLMEMQKK